MRAGRPLRLAVTGTQGQVVRALQERAAEAGITVVAIGRPALDLASGAVGALVDAQADAIVNAAAYTAVDQAESEPDLAMAVNGSGAGAVARVAASLGVPLIHISTDYVFDGSADRPYRESDPVGPASAYGRSKLEGERQVAAAQPDHAILRTAWLYSPWGRNFVRTMLRLAAEHDEVAVVDDQRGSPTSALDLADAVIGVARNLVDRPDDPSLRGVFHAAGGGETSWAGLAAAVFAEAARCGARPTRVRLIATAAYPTPARRPANSRLDCTRLRCAHAIALPDWHSSLPVCVRRLVAGQP